MDPVKVFYGISFRRESDTIPCPLSVLPSGDEEMILKFFYFKNSKTSSSSELFRFPYKQKGENHLLISTSGIALLR